MTEEQEAEEPVDDEQPEDDVASGTEPDAASEEPTTDETEDAETTDEETESGLQEGDFVELDYTARTVESDQLVDTTDPEVAEEEGIDDQQESFEPRTIVLGEGHLFETVEEEIVGSEVGDSGSVVVPAEEAFGEHDPEDVRTVSAEKLPEDDRRPGAQVTVDGEQGFVETIIGGRARVDFNHPLAGQDVEYEYEILDEVEDRVERAQGLFQMYIDQELEMWIETDTVEEEQMVEPDEDEEDDEEAEPEFETVEVEKETLYVEATPQLQMNQQWMFSKQQIAQDVMDKLDLDRVIVQETIDGGGGMMGGMGGMMGGMGGMGGGDVEEALEEADVDAEDIAEELDEE